MDQAVFDSVFYGLGAALFYAVGDLLAKTAVRDRDARVPLFLFTLLSLPLVGIILVLFAPQAPASLSQAQPLAYAFTSAVLIAVGYHAFYRGLEKGRVIVLAPLTGLYSVVTVVGGILFLHEALGANTLLAIALAIAGTFLSALHFEKDEKLTRVASELPPALWGIFAFGIGLIFSSLSVKAIGPYWDMLVERVIRVLIALVAYWDVLKDYLRPSTWPSPKLLFVMAVADALGGLSINLSLSKGITSVAIPITAVSPTIVVLLGVAFLRERLTGMQKIGIALVLASIVLVSF